MLSKLPTFKMPIRTTNNTEVYHFVTAHKDTYPLIDPQGANLSGRAVLITGASKGIGRTTAIRFAVAGCSRIAIAARSALDQVAEDVKKAALAAGRPVPQVLVLSMDVSSESSVKAAAEEVSKQFAGKLDILITNAGYLETWRTVDEADPAEWWKTWEVNIKGTFLTTHLFLKMLLRSDLKMLVTVSSGGAHTLHQGASGYQTSKFATCRFTECVDQEYNDRGLIAFTIHPGGVKTDVALNMPVYMHSVLNDTPELCADTLVYLAKERREWLAGRYISVEWDMAELERRKEEIVQKDLLKFRLKL